MKNRRNIIILSIIIFILLSLIPILNIFSYCFATGDDYGYGAATKTAWENSQSIYEVIKASAGQIKGVYNSWQGTWLSVFLFAFNPEIFGFGYYFFTPVIMLTLHIGSAFLMYKTFFGSKFDLTKLESLFIISLITFCNIQFGPSYQCNLFWWVGTVHYVVPFFLGCLALYNARAYLKTYNIKNIIIAFIAFTLVGGGNYQIAILTPLTLMCCVLWDIVIDKTRYQQKARLLFLPVIFEFIGLAISITAPGNKNRGGESFGFNSGYAIAIVVKCFTTAFTTIIEYLADNTLIFAVLVIYGVIMFQLIKNSKRKSEDKFKSPVLMVIMSFCLYAASFAPALYADVGVSGGVFNTNLYVFVIGAFFDIAYLEGYYIKIKKVILADKSIKLCNALVFILLIVLVIMGRHSLKTSTSYVSYAYAASGQADDYKKQATLQYKILSDKTNAEAVVPFINNDQGPLQHMPVTGDPSAWTNTVTSNYFGKKSVIAIDRDIWIQEYGSSYGY